MSEDNGAVIHSSSSWLSRPERIQESQGDCCPYIGTIVVRPNPLDEGDHNHGPDCGHVRVSPPLRAEARSDVFTRMWPSHITRLFPSCPIHSAPSWDLAYHIPTPHTQYLTINRHIISLGWNHKYTTTQQHATTHPAPPLSTQNRSSSSTRARKASSTSGSWSTTISSASRSSRGGR